MKKILLLSLTLIFFSCGSSDNDSEIVIKNDNSELIIGKWAYASRRINNSIVEVINTGEGCPDFKPDYIQFTENGRYIQFAFSECKEEFVTTLLYIVEGENIIVSIESTNEEAFVSEILEVSKSTLILRTISGDIVLEEGFTKIE